MNAIIDNIIIKYLESFKKLVFFLKVNMALPSTITRLEIALTKVSTVLIVNEIPKIITAMDKNLVLALTDYGGQFASAISSGNLVAVQFHPEKSGSIGLEFYRNFLQFVKANI